MTYIYSDEDNEPMNEQAYEYLRDKSRKGRKEHDERTREQSSAPGPGLPELPVQDAERRLHTV